jgi:hypothetical protein
MTISSQLAGAIYLPGRSLRWGPETESSDAQASEFFRVSSWSCIGSRGLEIPWWVWTLCGVGSGSPPIWRCFLSLCLIQSGCGDLVPLRKVLLNSDRRVVMIMTRVMVELFAYYKWTEGLLRVIFELRPKWLDTANMWGTGEKHPRKRKD